MKRRDTVYALLALAAAPLAADAQQQSKIWRIALLRFGNRASAASLLPSLELGLRELGYVEGRNLILEQRYADGSTERLTSLATELVRLKVDVIVASDSEAVRAAQKVTSTIPIVMSSMIDPVASGFVKSLARPDGNITGISNMTGESISKLVELLIATAPKISRIALLLSPANPAHASMRARIERAAAITSIRVLVLEAETPQQIESGFVMMAREGAQALIVATDAFFVQQRLQISALALNNRLPSISGLTLYAKAGLMMSYGSDLAANWRQSARYIDKILKGAKPADLPIEQSTTFRFVINLKTAKALGIAISKELLFRADEVIE